MVSIIDYKKFDTNRLEYTEPTKVKGGSYVAAIKYRGDNNELNDVVIQTPRLLCDTGIVKTETRSYLELDFDKEHWLFYEFITDIDDHNIVITEKNSETWFQQKFPLDVVEEFYKSPVKPGRGKNSPKIKIRLPLSKGKVDCSIYDNNKNVIHHSDISGNCKMICVLKLIGLRFLKQQVICEWYPLQIRVCDIEAKIPRSYLIDDTLLSDNEEVTEPEETLQVPEVSEQTTEPPTVVETSVETLEVETPVEPTVETPVLETTETIEEPTLETPVETQVEPTTTEVLETTEEPTLETPVLETTEEPTIETQVEPTTTELVETTEEPTTEIPVLVENNEIPVEVPEVQEFTVENLDESFVNEEDIEKIHEEKLAEFDKNNQIAELTEKINFLESEVSKRDSLIEKFKSLLN